MPPKAKLNPLLKLVLEMGPLVAFFVANAWLGILQGTAVFMVATVIALVICFALIRTIPIMPLVTGVFVLVFGGLTVLLANDLFIKLKPTIVNLSFAIILTVGLVINRMFIKIVLDSILQLTDRGWLLMTRAWIGFFITLAMLNEIVWRNFSTDAWVKYKVFGVMPMTFLFTFALVPIMMKHAMPEEPEAKREQN